MSLNPVHTAGNAVPPLDDELEGLLEDLAAVHDPAADQMIAGLRLMALNRYSVDQSQTRIAWLGGGSDGTNFVTALARVVARLADSDTNPALRELPLEQQKNAARAGELAYLAFSDPDLHETAAEACGAIDGI